MPKPLQVKLSQAERSELERIRDRASRAYLRERASAILKVADGLSASQVAHQGLLKRRQYQTICDWVRRYQAEGIEGLYIRQGRGRKAAFFPQVC